MQITSIPKFNYNITFGKNNAQNKTQLASDVFQKNTSFKGTGMLDDKSFSEFQIWSRDNNFLPDVSDIVNRTGKILGSGFEGETYAIPNSERWVVKRYKRSDILNVPCGKANIAEVRDICPDLNIGQAVARVQLPIGTTASSVYYIHKKQKGDSYGVSYQDAMMYPPQILIGQHLRSLNALASAPNSTYDKCIEDINTVTKSGYKFDCCNPHNFMFDHKKKSINFVDINDRFLEKGNQYGDVLYSLLDGEYGIKLAESTDVDKIDKAESEVLTRIIINKFFSAMKRNNVKFDGGIYFDRLLDSNILNTTLVAETKPERIAVLKQMKLM